MKQIATRGIVLSRTEYGEADRIISVLTPDQGKLRLIAKGVKKLKSKLAGGIELFSVSDLTYIQGRKDLGTLISARLERHYGGIVKAIDRTMLGYELIKRLDKAVEDQPEEAYFDLLQQVFQALDDPAVGTEVIRLWFAIRLLALGGYTPNLQTDSAGKRLVAGSAYSFSLDDMTLTPAEPGLLTANHIKFLRLGFAGYPPKGLDQVRGSRELTGTLAPLVQAMAQTYLRYY